MKNKYSMFKVGLSMRCFGVGSCGVAVLLVIWAVPSGRGGAWTVPG